MQTIYSSMWFHGKAWRSDFCITRHWVGGLFHKHNGQIALSRAVTGSARLSSKEMRILGNRLRLGALIGGALREPT